MTPELPVLCSTRSAQYETAMATERLSAIQWRNNHGDRGGPVPPNFLTHGTTNGLVPPNFGGIFHDIRSVLILVFRLSHMNIII